MGEDNVQLTNVQNFMGRCRCINSLLFAFDLFDLEHLVLKVWWRVPEYSEKV